MSGFLGMCVIYFGIYNMYKVGFVGHVGAGVFAAFVTLWMMIDAGTRANHHTTKTGIYGRMWLCLCVPWFTFRWVIGSTFVPETGTAFLVVYFAATVWSIIGALGAMVAYPVTKNEGTEWMRGHGWHPWWDNELLMPWIFNPDSVEQRRNGLEQAGPA